MNDTIKQIIEALEYGSFSVISPPQQVPVSDIGRSPLQPAGWFELELGGVSSRRAAAEIKRLVQENDRQANEIDSLRKQVARLGGTA